LRKGFENSLEKKTRNILIAKIERFRVLRVDANLEGKFNLENFRIGHMVLER
jgi:hypothetical protein